MDKIWLIIKREYWTRVRKKSFILATLLAPLGFMLLMGVSLWLSTQGAEEKSLAVLDEGDILQTQRGRGLKDSPYLKFKLLRTDLETAKKQLDSLQCVGLLHIPTQDSAQNIQNLRINYYSDSELGLASLEFIKSSLSAHIKSIKVKNAGLDEKILASFETSVELNPKPISKTDTDAQDQGSYRIYIATALGGIMMFLIYLDHIIYGNMVMRSVMEEKTNRIVEVIISSVKPFSLMMGKIVGVGAVGITQFLIWAITLPLLYMGLILLFAPRLSDMASQVPETGAVNIHKVNLIMAELSSFNYTNIVFFFLIFFVMGYLLYASLFAAVGSAMSDDWGEGQSLTLIIAIPVIIGFYIGMAAIQNPNGSLAFWSSLFPLFAPIVMPARIVFDPPWWQIALSMLSLGLCAVFFIWLSGRIYRVGILMYGKKVGFKEFATWIFRRD